MLTIPNNDLECHVFKDDSSSLSIFKIRVVLLLLGFIRFTDNRDIIQTVSPILPYEPIEEKSEIFRILWVLRVNLFELFQGKLLDKSIERYADNINMGDIVHQEGVGVYHRAWIETLNYEVVAFELSLYLDNSFFYDYKSGCVLIFSDDCLIF